MKLNYWNGQIATNKLVEITYEEPKNSSYSLLLLLWVKQVDNFFLKGQNFLNVFKIYFHKNIRWYRGNKYKGYKSLAILFLFDSSISWFSTWIFIYLIIGWTSLYELNFKNYIYLCKKIQMKQLNQLRQLFNKHMLVSFLIFCSEVLKRLVTAVVRWRCVGLVFIVD